MCFDIFDQWYIVRFSSTKFDSQSGMSYVELLVVIVIISIVASLAILNRGSANEQFQRQNASRELKVAFERARFDSVKRRADGTIPYASVSVEATQFVLITDVNMDGDVADAGDSVAYPYPPNVTVVPRSGLTLPVSVSFNRRGEPSFSDVTFLFCNGTCDFNNDTPSNADIVHVTPTGTVNLLPGGSNIPTFNAPVVTPVNSSSGIRSETYIAP